MKDCETLQKLVNKYEKLKGNSKNDPPKFISQTEIHEMIIIEGKIVDRVLKLYGKESK